MAVTLATNPAALNAQRRLGVSSADLNQALNRLSSGLRINRAGDDAAGLSVASLLNVDARVYQQGIRNLNDGISYLNIAEGGTQELKGILFRLRELATQASNGTYSNAQRGALDVEVQALRKEYNRIVQSTSFNNLSLLQSGAGLTLQAGYGAAESLQVSLGIGNKGDGTFQSAVSYVDGDYPAAVITADINGDGILDLVSSNYNDNRVSVFIGNGNGTFKAQVSSAVHSGALDVAVGDINGDGRLDLIAASYFSGPVTVLLGNGNGTFKANVSYNAGVRSQSLEMYDLNGDGDLDIVATDYSGSSLRVLFGNGNGTFRASTSYPAASGTVSWSGFSLALADVNGDGRVDALVGLNGGVRSVAVYLGNGNGTFLAYTTLSGLQTDSVTTADVNGDGNIDIVLSHASTAHKISILLGNGDGTFKPAVTYAAPNNPSQVAVQDMNSDGFLDLIAASGGATNGISLLLGNGDGTFRAYVSQAGAGPGLSLAIADVNGDSVNDIVAGFTTVNVLLGNSSFFYGLPSLTSLSVRAQDVALGAQDTIDSYLHDINIFSGILGSFGSRLETATNALSIRRENYVAAAAQITDADVADETAKLVRARSLQQAGALVLAQANLLPDLALQLLDTG